jgi:hypothetical protein
MPAQLPQPLPLEQNPVVVPPREEIAAERRRRGDDAIHGNRGIEHGAGPIHELLDVDADVVGQRRRTGGHVDQTRGGLLGAPQGRAEVGVSVRLGHVGPELTGDRAAGPAAAQTQVGDQPLNSVRHIAHGRLRADAADGQLEPVEQGDMRDRGVHAGPLLEAISAGRRGRRRS